MFKYERRIPILSTRLQELQLLLFGIVYKYTSLSFSCSFPFFFCFAFFRHITVWNVCSRCMHLGQKPRRRYLELVKSVHCQSDSFDASRVSRIHVSSRSYRDGSAKRLARDAVSLIVTKVTLIYLLFSY